MIQFGECSRRFQWDVGGAAAVDAVKASILVVRPRRLRSSLVKDLLRCLISCYWNTDNLTKNEQTFSTCADIRPGVLTRVFEAEHVMAQEDNLLEKLHPQFDHDDANRISNVSAQGETSDEAMELDHEGSDDAGEEPAIVYGSCWQQGVS